MASRWSGGGPVSLPPLGLAYGAAALILLAAVAGTGLGLRAAYRAGDGPDVGGVAQGGEAGALTAQPLVDITPTTGGPEKVADDADSGGADADKAEDLAAQTAKAQALQAEPTAAPGDIDQIMTSASEKPPTPAKAGPQEAAPSAPVKSDVPF